jgi:hypothetical protein
VSGRITQLAAFSTVLLLFVGACSSTPGGGMDLGAAKQCKRGIATNTAPGADFSSLTWWYNWSLTGGQSAVSFVPMVWGQTSVGKPVPSGAQFVLGFNEPNFQAQSNLTPQQAAALWPMVEAQSGGLALVSPAVNFCGPAAACNGTDPYQYLKDFFTACSSCRVDYVAVHWYNCDLPSLKDYLEPGGALEGFEQFSRPLWLTEFSCDGSKTEADNEAYMRAAIPYLEGKANVFRYSWFSADPIPTAKLINTDGTATALGQIYNSLPEACD